ncbi:MAG: hypothetical protein ABIH00_04070 [Armatimonadota bacterium]
MRKRLTLLVIIMLIFSVFLTAYACAKQYEEKNLKSPKQFSQVKNMPLPLRSLFLMLTPDFVTRRAPSFFQANNISFKMAAYAPDPNNSVTGERYLGLKNINLKFYPLTKMTVRYRAPHTKGWDEEYHYLKIYYSFVNGLGEISVPAVEVEIKYWHTDIKDKKRFEEFKAWYLRMAKEKGTGRMIDNVPVYAPEGEFPVMVGHKPAGKEDIWKKYKVTEKYRFVHGRFTVDVSGMDPVAITSYEYWDHPAWFKEGWPEIYQNILTDVNHRRVTESLVQKIIGYLENVTKETAGSKTIRNLKLNFFVSQTLDNPPKLIHKKPALSAVKVTWDNVDIPEVEAWIVWRVNEKVVKKLPFKFKQHYSPSEIGNYKDYAVYAFEPDIYDAVKQKHEVAVAVKGAKDKNGKQLVLSESQTYEVASLGNPVISIMFVPLKYGSWGSNQIYNDNGERLQIRDFNRIRTSWLDYLKGIYPVAPECVKDVTKSNLLIEVNPGIIEKCAEAGKYGGLLNRLEEIYELNRTQNPKEHLNYIVGIVPQGYLGATGLTHEYFPHSVLIEDSSTAPILAHEIGHLLNIINKHNQDEYGKELLASPGFWVQSLTPIQYIRYLPVERGVKTVDLMDIDPKDLGNTWINKVNYEKLMKVIQERFGSTIKAY